MCASKAIMYRAFFSLFILFFFFLVVCYCVISLPHLLAGERIWNPHFPHRKMENVLLPPLVGLSSCDYNIGREIAYSYTTRAHVTTYGAAVPFFFLCSFLYNSSTRKKKRKTRSKCHAYLTTITNAHFTCGRRQRKKNSFLISKRTPIAKYFPI